MKIRFLIVLLAFTSYLSAQSTGSFSGQVIDEKTRSPLEGTTIVLEGTSIGAITDVNGYFSFENIPTKTYNIHGIIGFSKSIALELGSRNIRSNVIAPSTY